MLRIAIIGLGNVSHIHLAAIEENPNVSSVAVCATDETLRDTVSVASFSTDYEEMITM